MGNSQQVDTVKRALELEICVAENRHKLAKSAPEPPKRNVLKRTYPKIVPRTKFHWAIALLPAILFFILPTIVRDDGSLGIDLFLLMVGEIAWIFIYFFAIYKPKKKKEISRIQNSANYKAQCAEADRGFDGLQEKLDASYQIEKQKYEKEILPKYQDKIGKARYDLRAAKAALDDLYTTTKIVPLQYREIPILQYIYDTISTSDFDVRYAIELYEKNEQRKLDEARLYEQQQANQLASEQNDIAEKMRREQNIANVVGAVQRHNTNKALNNMLKK